MGLYENLRANERTRRVGGERRKQNKDVSQSERRGQFDRRKGERRSSRRISKKISMRFQFTGKSISDKWDIIFIENISCGGVLFKLNQQFDQKLEIGDMIAVKISFPGDLEPISCRAQVIRIQKIGSSVVNEVAAYFIELSERGKARINEVTENFRPEV